MARQPAAKWCWETTDPNKSGSSGDLAKLFRHEKTKNPGVLGLDAPPTAASLLAREVIQNSWDAARELQVEDPTAPQFEIEFRFSELDGGDKRELLDNLDLDSLAQRVARLDRRALGLGSHDCLKSLGEGPEPLRTQRIVERGTTGMYGPWKQAKSHMFLALVSLGYTLKAKEGAGGSYGYGKAGLIKGSRIRTVVAYSCFRERPDDPGVTRRLLGMTYWGQHDLDGTNFTGFARFGHEADGAVRPFENDGADEVANSLGMDLRTPSDPWELGTTFLLLDSMIASDDLLRAVERWWWPALDDDEFVVTVVDADGVARHPRPKRDPVLKTFIDAWEVATIRRDSPREDEKYSRLSPVDVPSDAGDAVRYDCPGEIGLVADLEGWSYADQSSGPNQQGRVEHRSLVALTRGPKMVVDYFVAGRSEPYVRGVFLADQSVDDLLRRTEPKGHDAWQTTTKDGDVDREAAHVSKYIEDKVKQTVNNFRYKLKPPVPPPEDVNLPSFNEVMRRFMSGMGPGRPQPTPDTRPISIRLSYGPQPAGAGRVKMRGSATLSLSDHFEGDAATVLASILYRFIEDDRVGEFAVLDCTPPEGFTNPEPGYFRGVLEREHEVTFEFESEPYDANWSGRLIVNGEVEDEREASR